MLFYKIFRHCAGCNFEEKRMMKKFLPLLVAASFCVVGHAADNTPAAPAPADEAGVLARLLADSQAVAAQMRAQALTHQE
jgi:hypothetical protein